MSMAKAEVATVHQYEMSLIVADSGYALSRISISILHSYTVRTDYNVNKALAFEVDGINKVLQVIIMP